MRKCNVQHKSLIKAQSTAIIQNSVVSYALLKDMPFICTWFKLEDNKSVVSTMVPNDIMVASSTAPTQQQLIRIHITQLLNTGTMHTASLPVPKTNGLITVQAESLIALRNIYRNTSDHFFVKVIMTELEKIYRKEDINESSRAAECCALILATVTGYSGVAYLLSDYLPAQLARIQMYHHGKVVATFAFMSCLLSLIHKSDTFQTQVYSESQAKCRIKFKSFIQTLVDYAKYVEQTQPHPISFFISAFASLSCKVPELLRKSIENSDQSLQAQQKLLFDLAQICKKEDANLWITLFDLDSKDGREMCMLLISAMDE